MKTGETKRKQMLRPLFIRLCPIKQKLFRRLMLQPQIRWCARGEKCAHVDEGNRMVTHVVADLCEYLCHRLDL